MIILATHKRTKSVHIMNIMKELYRAYHCLEVNKVEITDSLSIFSFHSPKHESSVLINAGEGEARGWRRSGTTDGRGGPGT